MKKRLLLSYLLYCTACSHTTPSAPPKLSDVIKAQHSIPDTIEIAHTDWEKMGTPLFDIESYQHLFYKKKLRNFEISKHLIHNAHKQLYRLSKEDYIRIFQQHTTPATMNVVHHKVMQQEYLYSQEGPFHVDVTPGGQERTVTQPPQNGYAVDFTTLFSASPQQNKYQISMIFHANQLYGQPTGLSAWEKSNYAQTGQVLCCSFPSILAVYEKNDSLEYQVTSELLDFPYFKRTEVHKQIKDSLIIKVDSTITILKFGIHRVLSVGDQKKYINGRLKHNFMNPYLQIELEY